MKPISASHIEKWNQCKRREAFIYRLGIREATAKSAQAGTHVHAKLEGQDAPDEWNGYPIKELADKMRLFEPGGITQREYEFTTAVDGVEFTGRIDGKTALAVCDYKTTSQKKYVKSLAALGLDAQRLLYVALHPEIDYTLWLYGVWKDLSVHLREVTIDRKLDRERFKLHVLQPAEEILAVPEGVDPLSLPASPGACGLYPPAGCPFKNRCTDLKKPMSNNMSKLMEKLLANESVHKEPEGPAIPASAESASAVRGSAPRAVAAPVGVADAVRVSETSPVGTLYIDCLPVGGPIAELTYSYQLLATVCKEVANDAGVPHPLLMDFAKGPPWIALQLVANLKKSPVKYLYLDSRTAEGRAVVQALMEVSANIVRGL
jgi:CRISPR/Cas system-associated exonuclease Cas4 (RecB family)